MMSDNIKTFNKWNALGYRIIKGSKAVGFSESGEPLFNHNQVYADVYEPSSKRNPRYPNQENFFGGENPDEMDYDLGLCGQD